MNTSAVNGQTTTTNAASTGPTKTLGKEDFLRLFTTQLRAQNPLNPMDSADFTAQLAQFSSLEQLTNLNTQMNSMLLFQGSLQNMLTADLIGKQVKTDGGEFHAVTSVIFENNGTSLVLDDGTKAQLGRITEMQGGK